LATLPSFLASRATFLFSPCFSLPLSPPNFFPTHGSHVLASSSFRQGRVSFCVPPPLPLPLCFSFSEMPSLERFGRDLSAQIFLPVPLHCQLVLFNRKKGLSSFSSLSPFFLFLFDSFFYSLWLRVTVLLRWVAHSSLSTVTAYLKLLVIKFLSPGSPFLFLPPPQPAPFLGRPPSRVPLPGFFLCFSLLASSLPGHFRDCQTPPTFFLMSDSPLSLLPFDLVLSSFCFLYFALPFRGAVPPLKYSIRGLKTSFPMVTFFLPVVLNYLFAALHLTPPPSRSCWVSDLLFLRISFPRFSIFPPFFFLCHETQFSISPLTSRPFVPLLLHSFVGRKRLTPLSFNLLSLSNSTFYGFSHSFSPGGAQFFCFNFGLPPLTTWRH